MKIVDRYLLREYLIPVGYCLLIFSVMYVVLDLFSRLTDMIAAHVTVAQAARFYLNYLFTINGNVAFVVLVLPVCLLLGALYSLARLTRHNELTAMRASGMSLLRLMGPYMAAGIACSLVALIVQETVTPASSRRVYEFEKRMNNGSRQQVIHDFPYYNSSLHRNWMISEFHPRHPNKLVGVKVTQERPDGTRSEEIHAERAEWLDGHWWFFGCWTQKFNPQGDPIRRPSDPSAQPVEMPQFAEVPSDFENEVSSWEILSSLEMFRYIRAHPDLSDRNRASLLVDMHSRLAMPWTCIVVVLMGIPAGTKTGRQGMLAGVILAIMLFFCFYAAVHVGLFLGKTGAVWPWLAAWIPNIGFSIAGLVMLGRLR